MLSVYITLSLKYNACPIGWTSGSSFLSEGLDEFLVDLFAVC